MSMGGFRMCGTLKSRLEEQKKSKYAQIRRRREGNEGMALKI
jgi:hypothetical protein